MLDTVAGSAERECLELTVETVGTIVS